MQFRLTVEPTANDHIVGERTKSIQFFVDGKMRAECSVNTARSAEQGIIVDIPDDSDNPHKEHVIEVRW